MNAEQRDRIRHVVEMWLTDTGGNVDSMMEDIESAYQPVFPICACGTPNRRESFQLWQCDNCIAQSIVWAR